MGRNMLREKMSARLAELKQAEQKVRIELTALCTVIAEMEALLAPDEPTITTDEDITP
jgi:hypothetical protein